MSAPRLERLAPGEYLTRSAMDGDGLPFYITSLIGTVDMPWSVLDSRDRLVSRHFTLSDARASVGA